MAPRILWSISLVSFVSLLFGCGGGSGGGGGTGPSKTLRSIAIAPLTPTLTIGGTETYTVTASYSDGSTASVTAAWTSDNAAVLTIDGTGKAEGHAAGLATITAVHQGMNKTQLIQVVPDYKGTWQGDYSVTGCEETDDWREAELCRGSDSFQVGDLLPVQLVITQNGKQLTGTMSLGDIQGPLTGTIADGGTLSGTASLTFTFEGGTVTTAVSPLQLHADGERMTGSFSAESTLAGLAGHWVLRGDLRSVARVSTVTSAFGVVRRDFANRHELLAALRTR
jgi:hypothetical protein